MAKTYYGYVERDANSQINWAEVGKSVSDTLIAIEEERERKRAALDEMSTEFGEILESVPSGDFKAANTFALEHASASQEMALINSRLLKAGILKPKDFTIRMQNLKDGTNQAFDIAKLYQDGYSEVTKRTLEDKNQLLETFIMESSEQLAKLRNTSTYIDPNTNAISIGKMVKGEDGVMRMSDSKNDFKTTHELKNLLTQRFDKYDVNKVLSGEVELLGTEIQAVKRLGGVDYTGSITTLLDPTKKTMLGPDGKKQINAFLEMEDKMINSIGANPYHVTSILTENLVKNPKTGADYDFSWDEKDIPKGRRDDFILMKTDGSGIPQPEFTENQIEAFRDFSRTKFRTMIDREEKISAVTEPRLTGAERTALDKDKTNILAVGQLYFGGDGEVASALQVVQALDPNAVKVERTADAVLVTDVNGNIKTIPFKDKEGNIIPQEEWITGAAAQLGGITNVDEALKASGMDLTQAFSAESSGLFEIEQPPKKATPQDRYDVYLRSNFATNIFGKDEDDAEQDLETALASLGADYRVNTIRPGKDFVRISKGNNTISIPTNLKNEDEQLAAKKKLLDFLKANTSQDQLLGYLTAGLLPDLVEKPTPKTTTTDEDPNKVNPPVINTSGYNK